ATPRSTRPFPTRRSSDLAHATHWIHSATSSGSRINRHWCVCNHRFCGQQQASNRGGIFQCRTSDLNRVVNSGYEQIPVLTSGYVKAFFSWELLHAIHNNAWF